MSNVDYNTNTTVEEDAVPLDQVTRQFYCPLCGGKQAHVIQVDVVRSEGLKWYRAHFECHNDPSCDVLWTAVDMMWYNNVT